MSQLDERSNKVAEEVFGKKIFRMFLWTIILYMCSIFWIMFEMPDRIFLFEAMGLMIVSFLSVYGAMSLFLDVFDNKVRARMKRFFNITKNAIKTKKVQRDE
jgi:apolipoprotein N-acyltransferase